MEEERVNTIDPVIIGGLIASVGGKMLCWDGSGSWNPHRKEMQRRSSEVFSCFAPQLNFVYIGRDVTAREEG